MAVAARLFPPAAKPKGRTVQPPVRAVRIAKSPRAARDPRFMKVVDRLQQTTARTLRHPPAASKAAQAGAAARAPANETLAAGKAGQVDAIQEAKTGQPAPSSFEQLLRAEIEKLMPKTLGDAEKFGQGGESEQLKGAVNGSVKQQKDEAAAPMKEASAAAPAPAGSPKEVTAIPADPSPTPTPVGAGAGMPAPKAQQEVSLEQSKQNVDQQMKDAEVTDTQLKKANDPRFSAVLDAKSKVKAQADQAPKDYRADEQKTLTQAAAQARGEEKAGLLALVAVKGKSATNIKSKQQLAKEQEERDRAQVVAELEAIYAQTRDAVNRKLDSLETDAMAMFQQGADAAFENMKSFVDGRMHKYKLDRYLLKWGPTIGAGLWIKDLLVGLPDEVNQFAEEGKQRFLAEMDALVTRVSAFVEKRLQEARDEVKRGQDAIKRHVEGLPKNLQKYGREAESNIQGKFDELSNGIEERKNDLAQKLAEKYQAASNRADEFVTQFKEANKGLVDGFIAKLKEIIEILKKLKDRILGLLKKGAAVIKKIIADPIGFLGNLLNAIKKGLSRFVSNIWTHIKAGFMTWLFGALAKAGIEIPSNLSLPSILKLALSVLGLTWTNIRPKIVKKIGERAVTMLEKVVELAQALFTGGPAALWAKIKDMVGDLKAMVITAIQDWLITRIVQSAIAKLVTMFNPAGAIVQAVITIFNTVMFLVENIDSILDFVEAVLNSLDAIADGAIDGAAAWIESALARVIPLLIGFLARLIGLGGISEKIRSFIKKVQAPIDKAIDWVIDGFFKFVKGLFKGKEKDPEKEKKVQAGLAALDDLTAKYPNGIPDAARLKPQVAAVKAQHPVFKSLTVDEDNAGVVFTYEASPKKKRKGPVFGENWKVGKHVVTPPPKNADAGQSHHVPAKVLKQWIGEVLEEASKLPKRGHLKQAADKARADPEGAGLSAIWLSEKDHKGAHKPAKPAQVSGIVSVIKGTSLEIRTSADNLSAKPMQPTLTRSVHGDVAPPGSKAKTQQERIEEIVAAKQNQLGSVFQSAFNSLLGAGIGFVARVKLRPEKKDWKGPLRSLAQSTWSPFLRVPRK